MSGANLQRSHWADIIWPALLLLATAFALYAGSFGHAWTYDDFPVIVDNPDVRSLAGFWQDSYPGRPLRELTYLLDHALFGLEPAGWHIQNIFWHGMNAALLFMVLGRLRVEPWVAWATSLIFLVHPIQVEVVANISHRKDSLALCFALLAVLCYIEACASDRARLRWLSAALCAWIVALYAKQNAIVLPVILGAYEYAFVAGSRRILLRKNALILAAVGVAAGGLFFWPRLFEHKSFYEEISRLLQGKANYFDVATVEVYCRMVLKSCLFMVGKVVFPAGLALEYTYAVPDSWLDGWVVAAVALLVLYGLGLWLAVKRSPPLFWGLVWFGLFFLPVANLWPLSYFAADRYMYAPLVGLCLVFALAMQRAFPQPLLRQGVLAVLLIVLSTLTWQQNKVWRNPEALWTQAIQVSPDAAFALNNLGNVHFLKGDLYNARESYLKTVAVNPLNSIAHYNLGLIYERVGLVPEAMEHFEKFIVIGDPKYKEQINALRTRLGLNAGEPL